MTSDFKSNCYTICINQDALHAFVCVYNPKYLVWLSWKSIFQNNDLKWRTVIPISDLALSPFTTQELIYNNLSMTDWGLGVEKTLLQTVISQLLPSSDQG